jgi:hypothetical protein
MPDTRTQRGPHPRDETCFSAQELPRLRAAVTDLCWLLTRGYSAKAALVLVGDRHRLRARQRKAMQRCACSQQAYERRERHRVETEALTGQALLIDGYNVLLTVEAALSGGVLLLARDGVLRDLAALSGSYRRVKTTEPALDLVADLLEKWGCSEAHWLFDRPISNSGRLKALIEARAAEKDWPWIVELVPNPDRQLRETSHVIATADSGILDRCERWLNLARLAVEQRVPRAWVLEL